MDVSPSGGVPKWALSLLLYAMKERKASTFSPILPKFSASQKNSPEVSSRAVSSRYYFEYFYNLEIIVFLTANPLRWSGS